MADADQPAAGPAKPASAPNLIRRLYDWILSWAHSPYGAATLVVLAVAEASFFPIPPDVLLIALALSIPSQALRYAASCTLGSVVGGIIGYHLGFALWNTVEPLLIPSLFSLEDFEVVMTWYDGYGAATVVGAELTRIPYKVITVAGGVAHINFIAFVLTSIVGRGARFFLIAALIHRYGDRAKDFIDRHFNRVAIVFTLVGVGAFVVLELVLR